jgi:predicted amidohydrolase
MKSSLRVLAVQADLRWHQPQANRDHIRGLLEAHAGPLDLILLPEMFTTGFSMEALPFAEESEGDTAAWMEEIARESGALVCGSILVEEEGRYFNRCLMVSAEEGLTGEYDKRHLFRLAGEDKVFTPGEAWAWVSHKGWNLVPQICYDLRFPVWSRNRWNEDENRPACDLLFYVANWPQARIQHWDLLLQARAIENQCFVVGVNRVGSDPRGHVYPGHSAIIHPSGEILARGGEAEGLAYAELDSESLRAWREKFPFWKDADRFDLYP